MIAGQFSSESAGSRQDKRVGNRLPQYAAGGGGSRLFSIPSGGALEKMSGYDMKTTRNKAWLSVLGTIVLGCLGCGGSKLPELGTVRGKVTMDGSPLAGAMVQFHSESGGRPGTGTTDKDGVYELIYLDRVKGAMVGPNRVEITTVFPEGEPTPGKGETIPAKYSGTSSTLKAVVKPGTNTFDFALESGGAKSSRK